MKRFTMLALVGLLAGCGQMPPSKVGTYQMVAAGDGGSVYLLDTTNGELKLCGVRDNATDGSKGFVCVHPTLR